MPAPAFKGKTMNEPQLLDADPVVQGALYVADGRVVVSSVGSTVSALRTALGASKVTACNAADRRDAFFPGGLPILEV